MARVWFIVVVVVVVEALSSVEAEDVYIMNGDDRVTPHHFLIGTHWGRAALTSGGST